jgi:hypothetical protein
VDGLRKDQTFTPPPSRNLLHETTFSHSSTLSHSHCVAILKMQRNECHYRRTADLLHHYYEIPYLLASHCHIAQAMVLLLTTSYSLN